MPGSTSATALAGWHRAGVRGVRGSPSQVRLRAQVRHGRSADARFSLHQFGAPHAPARIERETATRRSATSTLAFRKIDRFCPPPSGAADVGWAGVCAGGGAVEECTLEGGAGGWLSLGLR